jgi:integrase/recombinase XerC
MDDLIRGYLAHLEGRRSPNTIEHYTEILGRMDRELAAGLPYSTTAELEIWINADGRCNKTREHYRTVADGFFGWATDPRWKRLDFNPAALIDPLRVPRRKPRVAPVDQVRYLLKASGNPYRRWYLLGSHGGLRCIEIAGLRREHVTETKLAIIGKGDVERWVPTHPLIWAEVRDLPEGPLALRLDGRPADRRYISRQGAAHMQDALGLKGMSMHRLRGYFATASYEASGRDIRATQELLGHANVSTTQGYIEASTDNMRRGVTDLPEVA